MTCVKGCGRDRYARRLCRPCYRAARRADALPAPVISNPREVAGRREDFAELRAWGESIENAARRLGVCLRTAERYEHNTTTRPVLKEVA